MYQSKAYEEESSLAEPDKKRGSLSSKYSGVGAQILPRELHSGKHCWKLISSSPLSLLFFLPLSRSFQDLPLLAGCQALNSWVIWSSLSPIPPSIPHNPVPTYLLTSLCLMPDFCILLSSGDFSEMKIWMVTSWMTVLGFPEITPVQSLQTLPVQVQGQLCFSPVLQSQKHLKHFVSVSLPVKWRWQ